MAEDKTVDKNQDFEAKPQEVTKSSMPRQGALSSIKNKINEKEIKNNLPAIRLIVESKYKLEAENRELLNYKDQFYEQRVHNGVLSERIKALNTRQLFSTFGGVLLGLVTTIYQLTSSGLLTAVAFVVGILMILVGYTPDLYNLFNKHED
jgi:hypothetical protein